MSLSTQSGEASQLTSEHRAGYIRLHHLLDLVMNGYYDGGEYPFTMALTARDDRLIASAVRTQALLYWTWRQHFDPSHGKPRDYNYRYYVDLAGDSTSEQIESRLWGSVRYAGRLASLPDKAVIKSGATNDIICDETCDAGEHCGLKNVAKFSKFGADTIDSVDAERVSRDIMVVHLQTLGMREGVDFALGTEMVTVHEEDGTPLRVDAPYALFTMSAIRKAAFTYTPAA